MKLLTRLLPLAAFAPMFALAQGITTSGWLDTSLTAIRGLIDTLIPFIFALAILVFIWGVFNYFVLGGADEGKRETGRSFMIYALVGIVVMVAVWGIVNVLVSLFGFNDVTPPTLPTLPPAR